MHRKKFMAIRTSQNIGDRTEDEEGRNNNDDSVGGKNKNGSHINMMMITITIYNKRNNNMPNVTLAKNNKTHFYDTKKNTDKRVQRKVIQSNGIHGTNVFYCANLHVSSYKSVIFTNSSRR
jgi:hypothetical protein